MIYKNKTSKKKLHFFNKHIKNLDKIVLTKYCIVYLNNTKYNLYK